MTKLSDYRVLVAGILSPLAALFLYALVYSILTRASGDLEKDWLFRLSLSTLAMTLPFLVTLRSRHKGPSSARALVIRENRFRHRDSLAGSRLESCERRHHPLEAVPKHGDAGRRRAALRYPGPFRKEPAPGGSEG